MRTKWKKQGHKDNSELEFEFVFEDKRQFTCNLQVCFLYESGIPCFQIWLV